jgi:hypothetical protein
MTIANDTFDDVLAMAASAGSRVVVYAETGASFAAPYLEHGIAAVVAERFPFYTMRTSTDVWVYRR